MQPCQHDKGREFRGPYVFAHAVGEKASAIRVSLESNRLPLAQDSRFSGRRACRGSSSSGWNTPAHSYLTVTRIGKLARENGVGIDWQPFWLFPVREEQGLPMPFPEGSARARYMWRDLERRAVELQIPLRRPDKYPVKSMPLARIGLIGAKEGWCQQFSEAEFRLHWTEGLPMSEPENIERALASAGQDVERVQQLAASIACATRRRVNGPWLSSLCGARRAFSHSRRPVCSLRWGPATFKEAR